MKITLVQHLQISKHPYQPTPPQGVHHVEPDVDPILAFSLAVGIVRTPVRGPDAYAPALL